MRNVFISYHHENDQDYRFALSRWNSEHSIFHDKSVDLGEIDENLSSEWIRTYIRDSKLRDSSVTILLVGTETKGRKHVDWELKSSMIDGAINKKSGILVINLPTTGCSSYTAAHGDPEKAFLYPAEGNWMSVKDRAEYERRYPYVPDRIIDNLLTPKATISVTNWETITSDPSKLEFLIDVTSREGASCEYDLARPMRRNNAPRI